MLVSTVDKSLDLVLLGNVGDVCVNAILAIAKFLDQSVNLFLVSAGESDLAAFLQKFLAACFADASGCTGNKNDFVFKIEFHDSFSLLLKIFSCFI